MSVPSGLIEPRRRWFVGAALAAAAGILMVLAGLVSLEVSANLRRLNSANTDTIQWTLGQIEVEMLDLSNAIAFASLEETSDLEQVRLEFDIVYSRINTLSTSALYERITKADEFQNSLDRLKEFLNKAVPFIDGPDEDLRRALPDLARQSLELRLESRKLAVVGLARFVEQADQLRQSVGFTLIRLAGLAVMLVAALLALVFYMLTIYRQTKARGTELAQANQRMNTILTTSLDGVIVTDNTGRIQEFNAAAQDIFGISQKQARTHNIRDFFADDQLARLDEKGLITGPVIGKGRMQLQALRKNGQKFPVEIAIQSAFDGGKQIFVAFLHDITKRVADQQELVTARDRALAGETAKANFLTVMSHEIRTPLNGLLGNLSLLSDTALNEEQAQFIRNMDISGKVLSRHVDSVLDLARFEAGKASYDVEPVNLNALLQNVIDGQAGLAEQQGIALSWRWVGTPVQWVRSNTSALEQVLLNLVGNAIKFTSQGHVTIEVEVSSANAVGKRALDVRVIDSGTGIPEEDLQKVFKDYVTRDSSFGRQAGGSGLGLGISRRIVRALGGDIGAESIEGNGSVFWFCIPTEISDSAAHSDETEGAGPHDRELNVLLVEDNDINRAVASKMLRREGHTVTIAADGKAAVALSRSACFDVILMDISMPKMDGFQATRMIRSGDGASKNSPVIAFSANVLPSDQHEFAEAGMNGFLSKPISRDSLVQTLRELGSGRTDTSISDTPSAHSLIDMDRLNTTLESLGSETLNTLLNRFKTELDALIAQTGDYTEPGKDLGAIADACHKTAASAAIFGATALRDALIAVENGAKLASTDEGAAARQALANLPQVWQNTKMALRILAA